MAWAKKRVGARGRVTYMPEHDPDASGPEVLVREDAHGLDSLAYAIKRINADLGSRTAVYLDPEGRERSAGTFEGKREAEKAAARKSEGKVETSEWIDPSGGKVTFEQYVDGRRCRRRAGRRHR